MYHILGFRFSSLLYYEMQQSKKFRHINGKGKYLSFLSFRLQTVPIGLHTNFSIICLHLYFSNLSPLSDEVKFLQYFVSFLLKGIWATTLANEKKLNRAFKVSSLASLSDCYILKHQVSEIEQTT